MASIAEAVGIKLDDYTWTTEGEGGDSDVSGDSAYLWITYSAAAPNPEIDGEPLRDSGVSLLFMRPQWHMESCPDDGCEGRASCIATWMRTGATT